jgi:hypothetical protein
MLNGGGSVRLDEYALHGARSSFLVARAEPISFPLRACGERQRAHRRPVGSSPSRELIDAVPLSALARSFRNSCDSGVR